MVTTVGPTLDGDAACAGAAGSGAISSSTGGRGGRVASGDEASVAGEHLPTASATSPNAPNVRSTERGRGRLPTDGAFATAGVSVYIGGSSITDRLDRRRVVPRIG